MLQLARLCAFADVIVLLRKNEQKIVELYGRLMKSEKKLGLLVITEKTQYMNDSRELGNTLITDTINVGQYEFKKIEQFNI